MKTIGLIGGMSWESTLSYYQQINRGVNARLGGLHSAKIILNSVDFADVERLQRQDNWTDAAALLTGAARAVESAGADFLMLCTNTMHRVAPEIETAIGIPLLHIADATAAQLRKDGIARVGLLGTRFTMEQAFYKDRLTDKFGIDVRIPAPNDRQIIHNVIYNELCRGVIDAGSRSRYLTIIDQMHKEGVDAVILGCTEIALLIDQQYTNLPLYDTTHIHASAGVALALD